jgi:23S rRNA pseudouridine1911/1915/1917 synthase
VSVPPSPTLVYAFRADRADAGERLDRVLLRHLAGHRPTRTQIQGWIAAGRARIAGQAVVKAARRLALGEPVEIDLPAPPERPRIEAEEHPLAVIFEDEHLVVLDKPPGVIVHPAAGRRLGTLYNGLLHYARDWGEGLRPSLVNRLDRDTSGLLLVAKSGPVHAGLAKVLRRKRARKDYLALAYGRAPLARGSIELRLRRDPEDTRRVLATRGEGLACTTLYEVLADGEGVTLLRCRLRTGRMHQIRVHLKAIGLPIVGDPLYGEPRWKGMGDEELAAACRSFPRQALHAWRLAFDHPVTGEWIEIEAAVPADLATLLARTGVGVE